MALHRTDYELVQTCGACPEQYDVFLDNVEVGYLRLRHGSFRAEAYGETVYRANPRGDGLFEYNERDFYLNEAIAAIDAHIHRNGNAPGAQGWTMREGDY